MKKLFIGLLTAFSLCANAATLLPVQLLNPAGSTSGQAIVSTGASSAPGWSNAVTVTGGTINNSTVGITTPLAGKFTTLQATSTITPSTTAGIVGTTLADNAQAGSVGECITATGSAVSLSNATAANITSVPLTAGDWFVYGNIEYDPAGTTSYTQFVSGINTTSGTLPASPLKGISQFNSPIAGTSQTVAPASQRINISSSGTAYLVGFAAFTVSTLTATGQITACRRR